MRHRATATIARVLGVALVLSLLAVPGVAQVTDEDVARAEQELADLQVELAALTDEWEAAVARRVNLEASVEAQSQALLETQLSVEQLERRAQDRAAEMYMDAALSGISTFLAPGSIEGAGAGIGYLDEVADADRQLIAELEAQSTDLGRQQEELGRARGELDDAVDALDSNVDQLIDRLDRAQERYSFLVAEKQRQEEEARRRAEEEARRQAEAEAAAAAAATSTTVASGGGGSSSGGSSSGGSSSGGSDTPAPPTTAAPAPAPAPAPSGGGRVCPVAGATSFSDSWGAPRSGGRAHKGTDLLAARGTPIVAIEDGRVSRLSNSSLGGLSIYFTGNSGDRYYYAHLDGFASGIGSGSVVSAGTVLGYNGTTGNAPANIPHLHFQWGPGGGNWVNPYPMLRPLC